MPDVEQVKATYRQFADDECRGYCQHYFTLAHAVADDDWLSEFIAQMPVIQANLFLAAVQFVTGPDAMPPSGSELKQLVQSHESQVAQLMRTRRTQTNEVGRCATLLPAFPSGPIAVIEVGSSAGLALLMDEFFYNYGDQSVGSENSPVRLNCEITGDPPIPESLPEIVWRVGLDVNPVDVTNDEDAKWLQSCVWPDHVERRERLCAAIEMARSCSVRQIKGSLLTDLPDAVADAPDNVPLVVFHSAVLPYVTQEDRPIFASVLAELSQQRELVWISNEAPNVIPEITALARPVTPPAFLLGQTRFEDGNRNDKLLGITHPHGATLKWLAND